MTVIKKRGPGRPKGSKNKKKKVEKPKWSKRGKGKLGPTKPKKLKSKRPKRIKTPKAKAKAAKHVVIRKGGKKKLTKKQLNMQIRKDLRFVKTSKMLGYCKKCDFQICTRDLISIKIFVCPSCNKRDRVGKLISEEERTIKKTKPEDIMSKREWMKSKLETKVIDPPPILNPLDEIDNDIEATKMNKELQEDVMVEDEVEEVEDEEEVDDEEED
jgi:hypothetical protein